MCINKKTLELVCGQDVKGSLEDEPLKACVASGIVSYVRKVNNEQGKLQEAQQPAFDTADAENENSGNEGGLIMPKKGSAEPAPASNPFHDDVNCLELDIWK